MAADHLSSSPLPSLDATRAEAGADKSDLPVSSLAIPDIGILDSVTAPSSLGRPMRHNLQALLTIRAELLIALMQDMHLRLTSRRS